MALPGIPSSRSINARRPRGWGRVHGDTLGLFRGPMKRNAEPSPTWTQDCKNKNNLSITRVRFFTAPQERRICPGTPWGINIFAWDASGARKLLLFLVKSVVLERTGGERLINHRAGVGQCMSLKSVAEL